MKFRKALMATAVSLALTGTAQAGSVLFDVNGTGTGPNTLGTDQFNVNLFTWKAGNLLIKDTANIVFAPGGTSVLMYSQTSLSTISGTGAGGAAADFSYNGIPGQLTYELVLPTLATAGAGGSIDYNPDPILLGLLNIYHHTSAISNDITGCGFGPGGNVSGGYCDPAGAITVFPGTLIYSGTTRLDATVNLTQSAALAPAGGAADPGSPLGDTDRFNDPPDVDEGITTRTLSLGEGQVLVDTVFANTFFFLSNISSMAVDISQTQAGGSPFKQANPSDQVVGNQISRTPSTGLADGTPTAAQFTIGGGGAVAGAAFRLATYGNGVNDFGTGSCAPGPSPCDVHLQNSSSSSILDVPLPEPHSLALLALGLGVLGLRGRMKKRQVG